MPEIAPAPSPRRFELRRHGADRLVLELDGLIYDLGQIDAGMEIIADFLGEQDFGERPAR